MEKALSAAPGADRSNSLAPDHPELTPVETFVRDFGAWLARSSVWRSRVGYWLRRALRLDRRYGIRFNAAGEKMGFYTYRAARHWAETQRPRVENYVVFHYDAIDMWMVGKERPEHTLSSFPPEAK